MKNKTYLFLILSLTNTINLLGVSGWTIKIVNQTNSVLHHGDSNSSDVYVHTTQKGCSDIWIGASDLQPGQDYSESRNFGSMCFGACYDKFRVKDQEFYIPNHCGNSTIEVRNDGVYLNGSRAHPYDCYNVPAWSIELTAKEAAMQTALLALTAAEQFLTKVGKPIATTGASATAATGKGVLVGAREVATGVLTSSEEIASFLLTALDLQKQHWDGSLQDLAKGNLANVQIIGKIFGHDFNIQVKLDVTKPYDALKDAANKIVDLLKQAADKMSSIKIGYQEIKWQDDMIKLALKL